MMGNTLHERIIENNDWATLLFVFCLALIVITKTAFENRFSDFLNLIVSDKYIKIYKDSSNLMSWFTVILFFVQIISLSFFIRYLLLFFGYVKVADWVVFIQIFTFLTFFILSKYFLRTSRCKKQTVVLNLQNCLRL